MKETAVPYSFTMDYKRKEIVMTTVVGEEMVQLRACEKDIDSMKRWFDIARVLDDSGIGNIK